MTGSATARRDPQQPAVIHLLPQQCEAIRRTCSLCLLAMLAGACASVPQQTALMRTTELQVAARELRATEYALAISVPGEIEASADEIKTRTGEPLVRNQVVQWKTEAIPAYYQTLFQADALVAVFDTLALGAQIEHYLTEGPGRARFGALQPVAVRSARKIRTDVVDRLRIVARRPDEFDRTLARIEAWARENPIAGPSLASRPSIVPFLAKIAGPAEQDVFGVAGEIGDSVADTARRLDIYSGYLPRAARWQSELLADELAARDEGQLAISALESVTKLMGRVDAITSPGGSIDHAATLGMASFRTERIETIDSFDRMKANVLAYLTNERLAVVAMVDGQARAALADIDRQRSVTMEQIETLGTRVFVAADGMRTQTVADLDELATRIILKVALTLAALMALAALLTVVVRKTVAPRPTASWPTLPHHR